MTGARYYNRAGEPIAADQWTFGGEDARVARTILPNGMLVSTVWLGLNHNYGDGPPLIFETMVFPSVDDLTDLDCERYTTEEQAVAGHQAMCDKWATR